MERAKIRNIATGEVQKGYYDEDEDIIFDKDARKAGTLWRLCDPSPSFLSCVFGLIFLAVIVFILLFSRMSK